MIGDSTIQIGSLILMEMIGSQYDKSQVTAITIRDKVGAFTIMGKGTK